MSACIARPACTPAWCDTCCMARFITHTRRWLPPSQTAASAWHRARRPTLSCWPCTALACWAQWQRCPTPTRRPTSTGWRHTCQQTCWATGAPVQRAGMQGMHGLIRLQQCLQRGNAHHASAGGQAGQGSCAPQSSCFPALRCPISVATRYTNNAARTAAGTSAELARQLVLGRAGNGMALVRPMGHLAGAAPGGW